SDSAGAEPARLGLVFYSSFLLRAVLLVRRRYVGAVYQSPPDRFASVRVPKATRRDANTKARPPHRCDTFGSHGPRCPRRCSRGRAPLRAHCGDEGAVGLHLVSDQPMASIVLAARYLPPTNLR